MQEKIVKPSPRKLKKAKEQGNVAISTELSSACILLSALLLIWIASPFIEKRFHTLFEEAYQLHIASDPIVSLKNAFSLFVFPMITFMALLVGVAYFLHFLQAGWIWSWNKRGKKGRARWIFFPLKLICFAGVSYVYLRKEKLTQKQFLVSATDNLSFLLKKNFLLLLYLCLTWLFLGICDFLYQKWKHYKQLHMTPQEVKEEKRETEGSQIKKRH